MPLFALGFRIFYLLAGLFAALAVPLWALQYSGVLPPVDPLWHAHEMLFGYTFAVIAGFLLTAVRNWTGLPTPAGTSLAVIAALWTAARIIGLFAPPLAGVVDLLFAAGVAWGIGRPILRSGNRNRIFIVFVLALGVASVGFPFAPRVALQAGLDVVLLVITVMAGRVVPGFTNNAVPGAGARRSGPIEMLALGSILALLACDGFGFAPGATLVAFAAAAVHAARLALWAPLKTKGRPILWILHLSYGWIVVHLLLRGLAGLELVPAVLATHALTVGGIGGMTLGMMTRTARGHTGRPLQAGRAELAAYLLVQAAAVVRVLLPLALPQVYIAAVIFSAALWGAAFLVFTIAYVPVLSRPRIDGRPG